RSLMRSIICTADRLFDATGAATMRGPVVHINGEHLTFLESFATIPPDTERHDFPGCTILPGLIDTHVHLVFCAAESNEAIIEQVTRESDAELVARALANARAAVHAGLTTVRDCGGKGRIVQTVRDRIASGTADGPDVLSCGAPITTRTGH